MANLYRAFARQVAADLEASELFTHLAEEEDQHGTQVMLLFRLLPSLDSYPHLGPEFERSVKSFKEGLAKSLRMVEERPHASGLQLARLALLLETSASESHAVGMIKGTGNPDLDKAIHILKNGDEKHRLRLHAFIEGREADAARRG